MLAHAISGGSRYFKGGVIGVDIFFVLSGFLITYLLVCEYDGNKQQISLWKFYVRRVLRLGPALIVMSLVVVGAGWIFFDLQRATSNTIDALIALFYAANWARAFDIHAPILFGHAWSLSIEEQFYLLWPLMLIALLRHIRSRMHIVYLICAGAVLSWLLRVWMLLDGATVSRLYNGLDTRADSLLTGCALGMLLASNLIREDMKSAIASKLRLLAPWSVAAFLGVLVYAHWRSAHMYYWLLVVVEVLAALMILHIFVAEKSIVKSFFSLRPLVWIGTISYGLYLWHFPIYRLLHEYGLTHWGMVAGTIATFIVAAASYYGMEKPIQGFKNRFVAVCAPPGQVRQVEERREGLV